MNGAQDLLSDCDASSPQGRSTASRKEAAHQRINSGRCRVAVGADDARDGVTPTSDFRCVFAADAHAARCGLQTDGRIMHGKKAVQTSELSRVGGAKANVGSAA
jgi:hypothetical protein